MRDEEDGVANDFTIHCVWGITSVAHVTCYWLWPSAELRIGMDELCRAESHVKMQMNASIDVGGKCDTVKVTGWQIRPLKTGLMKIDSCDSDSCEDCTY